MSEEKSAGEKGGVDRFVDFLFSKDNRKYVILFFLLAITLRIIFSLRIPFAADEMGYAAHSIGFIDSGKLQIHDQDAVWFFITDLFMKILNYNVFGLRFFSALTGALSVIVIYLIGKEIYNEKIALLAAFF